MHQLFTTLFSIGIGVLPMTLQAQLTLPPSGDNQQASVTQWMGPVEVAIHYSSPDVHGPNGEDRTGHIWGELVPYGMANLQFGYSTEANPSPWRGGANMNTTIRFSHDVLVEGKALKAGTYGLHFIPEKDTWTIIFSSNSTAWGSFFYQPSEDVLRVQTKPATHAYTEWLTYTFTDRQPDACTAELMWELLRVPIHIQVPDIEQVYIAQFRKDLQSDKGFGFQAWVDAANYCVAHQTNLDEALTWANYALEEPFFGRKNFTTLSCKANVLGAMGKTVQRDSVMLVAIKDPSASALDVHYYARGLQAQQKNAEALVIYKINYEKFPALAVTNLGLARGYAATGDYKAALKYAKAALTLNPDPQVRLTLEQAIQLLEAGKDFN